MEEGRVIGLEGHEAILEVNKTANCNGCKACCSLSRENDNIMIARVPNSLDAKEGDMVRFEVSETQQVIATAIVFLLPVLFLITGYLIGAFFLSSLIKTSQQGTGIIFSVLGFLLSLYVVKVAEDKHQSYFHPKMVKKSRR